MPINFYYLSGSPFAWKVWLALEHKRIHYELSVMSVDCGDLKTAEFRAINPRGKVPAVAHDGFALYESAAIVEYLDEAFPDCGEPLWPDNTRSRALGRRIAAEADAYLYPPIRRLLKQLLWRDARDTDEQVVIEAKGLVAENLQMFAHAIRGHYMLGDRPSAADYALYPLAALLWRLDNRRPEYELTASFPEALSEWQGRIESLDYFDKTWPPHWGSREH